MSMPIKKGKCLDIDVIYLRNEPFSKPQNPFFINSTFLMGIILDLALLS